MFVGRRMMSKKQPRIPKTKKSAPAKPKTLKDFTTKELLALVCDQVAIAERQRATINQINAEILKRQKPGA